MEEGGAGQQRRDEGTAPGEEPRFTNYRDIFKVCVRLLFWVRALVRVR